LNLNKLTLELAQRVNAVERVAKSGGTGGRRSRVTISGSAESVSTTAVGETLPRINFLLEDLARTSHNLDRLLTDLNEQPASLVFGRPAPAPGPGEPGFSPRRGASRQ